MVEDAAEALGVADEVASGEALEASMGGVGFPAQADASMTAGKKAKRCANDMKNSKRIRVKVYPENTESRFQV